MKTIIGTYRTTSYIQDCMASLDKHVEGITEYHFVDDSGDKDHHQWLKDTYGGTVHDAGKLGYTNAMQLVCEVAAGEEIFFVEEDFQVLEDVSLKDASDALYQRPYLAQAGWLRGPHFPVEHQHGGLIEALLAKGDTFDMVFGIWEQKSTFTCNPSVWRGEVSKLGWPNARWSEERKRDQLLRLGYRFGLFPGVKLAHQGERTGFGY